MSLFICPICQSPLHPAADTWRCDGSLHPKQTSHPFDVARQGYVNLLPVQQKKSKAPGDSQFSIIARQRFLTAGYYQPLRDLIIEKMTALLPFQTITTADENDKTRWLDIGCGEGYYTQAMGQQCNIDELIAADISKPAVVELAKMSKENGNLWYQQRLNDNKEVDEKDNNEGDNKDDNKSDKTKPDEKKTAVYPLVTSAAHLPLRAQSMNGISSIFSPILPEIFANTLAEKGYLIIAKPDIGHLMTLRDALFDNVREHDSDKFLPTLAPFFELVETHHVSSDLSLSASALADLLTMTPYAYRARVENRQSLLIRTEMTPFATEAKFVVYILQKKSAPKSE